MHFDVSPGTRYFHTDLGGPNAVWGPDNPQSNGNIWNHPTEIPGNGIDEDGNGKIDDVIGILEEGIVATYGEGSSDFASILDSIDQAIPLPTSFDRSNSSTV